MESYLDKLNPQQRAAVEYTDGAQLVIAGAGSGKTRVLTYKIVHLLAHGYEPWRIMALTFTNKAAREMRERITDIVGEQTAARLWMGTFHSIFARILRINAERIGYKSNFTIYDAADSKNLVKTIIKDLGLDDKVYRPGLICNIISSAKNSLISAEMYRNDHEIQLQDKNAMRPLTWKIYEIYRKRCLIAGAMDFDDLLYNTNVLLRDNADLVRHYREFFRYILVDEYQDTNFAQHTIVRLLCNVDCHVCMVGDDAQSIYSFRGANIQNILQLEKSFPGLQIFKLERNYRSTENIINAAGSLIKKNKGQIPKNVYSQNGPGARVEVISSYSDYEEAYLTTSRILRMRRTLGDQLDEFAILYRTNAQSRILEEALRKRDIPYRIYGGTSFFDRKEVRDAVAYFRVSVNPDDDEALRRIINFPTRGIGGTTLKKLSASAMEKGCSLWRTVCDPLGCGVAVNAGTIRKLDAFAKIVQKIHALATSGAPADNVVRAIYIASGLIDVFGYDNTPENISRRENLNELLNMAAQFVADTHEESEAGTTMADFLTRVSLSTDVDKEDDADNTPKVTLMTIHAAKGLEFGNVFVVGVEEELLPSSMSMDSMADIEEERRLLYVAITRAKRFCTLSYTSSRFRNGVTMPARPSRFLSDIDSRFLHHTNNESIYDDEPATGASSFTSFATKAKLSVKKHHTQEQLHRSGSNVTPPPILGNTEGEIHTVNDLRVGMTIEHNRFGKGTIITIDANNPSGARIIVNFRNVEIKTLLLKFARFAIID